MTTVPRRKKPRPARCNLDGGAISPDDQKKIDDFKAFLEAQPTNLAAKRRERGQLPVAKASPVEGEIVDTRRGKVFHGIVYGEPIPEGSKVQGFGRSVRNANEGKLKPWRDRIKRTMTLKGWEPLDGPLEVSMVFVFTPPKNWDGVTPPHNKTTNDIDKLQRGAYDGLTAAGVWVDDSRVNKVKDAEKMYVGQLGCPLQQAGMVFGVRVRSPQD